MLPNSTNIPTFVIHYNQWESHQHQIYVTIHYSFININAT